jgi:transposase
MGLQGKKERSAMQHVAIDLGSTESQVCIRRADGTIVVEKKHPTRSLEQLMKTWPPSRVVLETSSEAFRIADRAKDAGHEVRVVRARLSKELGVGDRGVKNDQRDARKLSEVSCRIDLPSVHIPSEQAREWRSAIRSREMLIESRTKAVNHVRGWLRTQVWTLRRGATETFPMRVREKAVANNRALPPHIEDVLVVIEVLNTRATASMKRISELAKNSELCRRLMTIPGIGPVTSVSFVAAIDDVKRFEHAYLVQSYLGLTPGEDSSSKRERRTSITKAGPASVRRTLIQAAWVAFRRRPNDPMVRWAKQVADRRGNPIAVVALARKMAGVMFALWRDNTSYSPLEAAMPMALKATMPT